MEQQYSKHHNISFLPFRSPSSNLEKSELTSNSNNVYFYEDESPVDTDVDYNSLKGSKTLIRKCPKVISLIFRKDSTNNKTYISPHWECMGWFSYNSSTTLHDKCVNLKEIPDMVDDVAMRGINGAVMIFGCKRSQRQRNQLLWGREAKYSESLEETKVCNDEQCNSIIYKTIVHLMKRLKEKNSLDISKSISENLKGSLIYSINDNHNFSQGINDLFKVKNQHHYPKDCISIHTIFCNAILIPDDDGKSSHVLDCFSVGISILSNIISNFFFYDIEPFKTSTS